MNLLSIILDALCPPPSYRSAPVPTNQPHRTVRDDYWQRSKGNTSSSLPPGKTVNTVTQTRPELGAKLASVSRDIDARFKSTPRAPGARPSQRKTKRPS